MKLLNTVHYYNVTNMFSYVYTNVAMYHIKIKINKI